MVREVLGIVFRVVLSARPTKNRSNFFQSVPLWQFRNARRPYFIFGSGKKRGQIGFLGLGGWGESRKVGL
jgi:hypothetical protein